MHIVTPFYLTAISPVVQVLDKWLSRHGISTISVLCITLYIYTRTKIHTYAFVDYCVSSFSSPECFVRKKTDIIIKHWRSALSRVPRYEDVLFYGDYLLEGRRVGTSEGTAGGLTTHKSCPFLVIPIPIASSGRKHASSFKIVHVLRPKSAYIWKNNI